MTRSSVTSHRRGSDFAFQDVQAAIDRGQTSEPQAFAPPTSGTAANGLPIFNWDQAAAQLTRASNGWLGDPAVVTFAFRSTAPGAMPDDTGGFGRFSAAQIAMTLESLALWSEVANIVFTRVQDGDGYSNNATMLFSSYSTGAEGASAFAYYPGSTAASASAGDVWVNISLANNNSNLVEGAFGPHTMAHEIGHAIGIAHPADYDASDATAPTYPASSVYWQDSRMFTVMSYFGSGGPGGSLNAFSSGPQLHDIAAAQLLYGANMSTRTGNTTYGFNSNTGHAHFTLTADGQSPVFSIWDAGGNDTLDLSGFSTPSEIDLRAEAFSSAGPGNGGVGVAIGNISIARGAVIENAIGGSGNDTLIGNTAANLLNGGAGADNMSGSGGDDQYFVDNAGDVVTETINQGRDTVYTAITYTLPANVEDLATAVSFAINLFGNALDNLVVGNAAVNGLDGAAGADTLIGGGGNDLYFIDNIGDVIIEGVSEGAGDVVYTTLAYYQLGDNVEQLSVTGAAGTFAVGNSDANLLVGGAGADALDGRVGVDTMVGAAGNDSYYVDNIADVIIEGANEGTDVVYTSLAFYQLGDNVEQLSVTAATGTFAVGNGLANLVVGGAGADALDGAGGIDTLVGGGGNDSYYVDNVADVIIEGAGEGTADVVYTSLAFYALGDNVEQLSVTTSSGTYAAGNSVNNLIAGNAGADALEGRMGGDVLVGNGGADTFVYNSAAEGGDAIVDFVSSTDHIRVDASGFGGGLVAGGAVTFFSGSNPVAGAGGALLYDTDDGRLFWDSDGAGGAAAILVATLSGAPTLLVSDIFVGP